MCWFVLSWTTIPLAGPVCAVVLFGLVWFAFYHLFVFEKYQALRKQYKYIYAQTDRQTDRQTDTQQSQTIAEQGLLHKLEPQPF
jgi:hypothetical protein